MNRTKFRLCSKTRWYCAIVQIFVGGAVTAQGAEVNWPREIQTPEVKIVMYQPQLESLTQNDLAGRAAVTVTPNGETEPIFGAVWINARVSTDREERLVELLDVTVPDAKFPDVEGDKVEKLKSLLRKEIPTWNNTLSLDRLLAMLGTVEREKAAAEKLKTDPPKIIFVTHSSVLVVIDGDPQMRPVENTNLMRVANTPFIIVFEIQSRTFYLKSGDNWLKASDIMGPWDSALEVPPAVAAVGAQEDDPEDDDIPVESDGMPQVVVTTEPAELIQTDGEPSFTLISGTGLLYMSNTESDVFLEIDTQRHYVLLSGRWYVADSMNGPWTYMQSDQVPIDFAQIPVGSAKEHVLSFVGGTTQAKEAVLDTYIPQTAAVSRATSTVTVEYDGEPQFQPVQETNMTYAVNTSNAVFKVGSMYYCCHEGVWFESGAPTGPWAVCVSVPEVIYTIPPSNPHYNVKYVRVYDYTPKVVYVGYTPGYVGCYHYGGTVVYGTGYYYKPHCGSVCYVRPWTWGFAVAYNPYSCSWGIRIGGGGYLGGWLARYGSYRGWWGPGRYHRKRYDKARRRARGRRNDRWDRADSRRDAIYNQKSARGGGPGSRGPGSVGPGSRGPGSVGPGSRGPGSTGPGSRGPGSTGPGSRGPGSVGQSSRGPGSAGPSAGRPGTGSPATTRPVTGRPGAGGPVTTQPVTRTPGGGQSRPGASPGRANNVFSDRNGNVSRRTDSGAWQQRTQNGWSSSGPGSRSPSQNRSNQKHYQSRERGASRSSNFNKSRSSGGPSRGGSGGRGGGGRGGGGRGRR